MSDLNMFEATIKDLFAKVTAGEMTLDAAAAAATATAAKAKPASKPREFGLSISPNTGKGLIAGLREAGRPVELTPAEFEGLKSHWNEIEKFFTDNSGKFVPDPTAKDKAPKAKSKKEEAAPTEAPAA